MAWWRRADGRSSWGRRVLIALGVLFIVLPAFFTAVYGILPVPITPLMVERLIEGDGLDHTWKPLDQIAPSLRVAVMAGEDNLFCQNYGFDPGEIKAAIDKGMAGGALRGASTISQQTAKNLALLPVRSFVRKGIEAYLTLWIETFWTKRRIIEVYLNSIEWGPGVFGAEAAARHWFHVPASALTRRQAALLAAVLPNPTHWSPGQPSAYVAERGSILERRMGQLGPLADCVIK